MKGYWNIGKLFAYLLLVTCSGCPDFLANFDLDLRFPVSAESLVDPKDAVAPGVLVGSYRGGVESHYDEDLKITHKYRENIHIGRAEVGFPDGFLKLLSVEVPIDSKGALTTSHIVFFVKEVDSRLIAHIPLEDGEISESIEKWDEAKCDGFYLVELKISENGLLWKTIDLDAFDKLNDAKVLNVENGHLIKNSRKELLEIIEAHGEKLFQLEIMRYRKAAR